MYAFPPLTLFPRRNNICEFAGSLLFLASIFPVVRQSPVSPRARGYVCVRTPRTFALFNECVFFFLPVLFEIRTMRARPI